MIVRWTEDKWEIVHYSHNFDDAQRMYALMRDKYGKVQLMVDERILVIHKTLSELGQFQKQFKDVRDAKI